MSIEKIVWIIIIILILICMTYLPAADHQHINNWAKDNHHTVNKIERCLFDSGPYYFASKNTRIYKVTFTDTERVCYFRFGAWFQPEHEWYP